MSQLSAFAVWFGPPEIECGLTNGVCPAKTCLEGTVWISDRAAGYISRTMKEQRTASCGQPEACHHKESTGRIVRHLEDVIHV